MQVLVKDHGEVVGVRKVLRESAFGNFSTMQFSAGGVRYGTFPESFRDEATGMVVCEIERARVYGRTPRVSRYVLACTLAQLGTDHHSGGGSRGYRLQNRAYAALKRMGVHVYPDSAVNRQLYAILASKYSDFGHDYRRNRKSEGALYVRKGL